MKIIVNYVDFRQDDEAYGEGFDHGYVDFYEVGFGDGTGYLNMFRKEFYNKVVEYEL